MLDRVSTASRLTLDRGSQTYQIFEEKGVTSTYGRDITFSPRGVSLSLPNLRELYKTSKISNPQWRSTAELIPRQDDKGSARFSDSLKSAISADSLNDLVHLPTKFKDFVFDSTPGSEVFVPEFIPLPTIHSPMTFDTEVFNHGDKSHPPSFNHYADDVHDKRSIPSQMCNEANGRIQFYDSASDSELDVLTNVTSLDSTASTCASRDGEYFQPR